MKVLKQVGRYRIVEHAVTFNSNTFYIIKIERKVLWLFWKKIKIRFILLEDEKERFINSIWPPF